ncbi:glycosyltransferase family 4 protein [Anaerobaca lacustris]|uniref:Glycosyltransferase family 4 protein n=1 Tax=Anaerobaca lacustris TaxID=3044600 RepID=A0AAW6TV85_9BACT|nr:glycosyltransferase family 4 protein [Sedimentisphaerales bacterium M17dextr]
MIHVLHIGPDKASRGGIASVIRTYVDCVADGDVAIRDLATVGDWSFAGKVLGAMKAYLLAPYAILRADIIHIHTASRNSWRRKRPFALLTKLLGRKLVIHIHGGGFRDYLRSMRPLSRSMNVHLLQLADCIICLSPRKLDEVAEYLGGVRTVTIANPCAFVPPVANRREGSTVRILFAGWICQQKGVFDLIRAFALVVRRCPDVDVELVVAGKGDVDAGKKLASDLGLLDKIHFPGWLDDSALREAYSGAHIYCLPSYVEGVPMSVLEAMVFSLPVVTCPVGGVPDVVRDGVHGVWIQPGDIPGIADALKRLIGDRDERERMGQAGRREVLNGYSTARVSGELMELYRSLAATSDPEDRVTRSVA